MFPTLWSVTVHDSEPTEVRDVYGNVTMTKVNREEPVYGWSPPSADVEDYRTGGTQVRRDLDLLVPPGFDCSPDDEITVEGVRYKVVGHPEDFNHGPFGFTPGGRVSLQRMEQAQ